MARKKIPAVFVRGGTSKGVFFHESDLPSDKAERDRILLHALGSPDPYKRQLNGMGGGLSSLSKAVIVAKSEHPDADVDYTFAQVSVDEPVVAYRGACGNLSASVGAFAVDEGLIQVPDGEAFVRVHMTNTGKVYEARFSVKDGMTVENGDYVMPGVSGTGAKITLDYLDPGGAITGALLPTGRVRDRMEIEGLGEIEVSLVDATNAMVFVDAADMGYEATEHPEALDADATFMSRMEEARRKGAVLMGMANRLDDVPPASPKVGIVARPKDFTALDRTNYTKDSMDLSVRVISMENVHRALPGTIGMCIAAAARIEGTIAHRLAKDHAPIRIGSPSGVVPVDADVSREDNGDWFVRAITVFRTQRRLMEGSVLVPDK
ncbi:MAG: PrpF domain-containing protein [Alphaproteobacteria bacterium]|nr:PrpF domain-containing protein [Alphaproteobacteria bacterium]